MTKILNLNYNQSMIKPQQSIKLCQARCQDIHSSSLIYAQGFNKSFEQALNIITNIITDPDLNLIIGLVNNQVIGISVLKLDNDSLNIYLSDFAINPNYQNQGFGKAILIQLIWQTQLFYPQINFSLKVKANNYKAISLYQKIGFYELNKMPINTKNEINHAAIK